MSGQEFDFSPWSENRPRLTEIIAWAATLGMSVAEFENVDDLESSGMLRQAFEAGLVKMPRNTLGNFSIEGDAAIVAYTQGYVTNKAKAY